MQGQKPEPKSDEIDLAQLFSRIGDSFRSGWMGFMRFLAELRRIPLENRVWFIVVIAAFLALGFYFAKGVRKRYYESKMIFASDYLNKKLAENIIGKLDDLSKESNKAGLARTLQLPDSTAANIIGFAIEPFIAETDVVDLEILKEQLRTAKTPATEEMIDEVIRRIEVENRHSFEITVRTLTPGTISTLQNAIVTHFQENPYIRKRVESNRRNLLDLKAKLSKDIKSLDSLKSVMYQAYTAQGKGSNNVLMNEKPADPSLVFKEGIGIYKLYEEVNLDIALQKDFEVVDGFTEFNEPASASVTKILFFAFLAGVIVAYLGIAAYRFNKFLANLE